MSWFGDFLVWIVIRFEGLRFDNLIKMCHVPFRAQLVFCEDIFQSCKTFILNIQSLNK
jgi:hypothetical protein